MGYCCWCCFLNACAALPSTRMLKRTVRATADPSALGEPISIGSSDWLRPVTWLQLDVGYCHKGDRLVCSLGVCLHLPRDRETGCCSSCCHCIIPVSHQVCLDTVFGSVLTYFFFHFWENSSGVSTRTQCNWIYHNFGSLDAQVSKVV